MKDKFKIISNKKTYYKTQNNIKNLKVKKYILFINNIIIYINTKDRKINSDILINIFDNLRPILK